MARQEHLLVGKIVGTHGIKGAVKVYSYAESDALFSAGRTLRLKDGNDSVYFRKIVGVHSHGKRLRIFFEGVTNRKSAEDLVGASLFIERNALPATEEGTYYWCDLIGMEVYTEEAVFIGRIDTIIPTGSNDVYVVKDSEKDGKKETLIPAVASVVKSVDIERGVMQVILPEGL